MRYTPGTMPDGTPLKVVNPHTGQDITGVVDTDQAHGIELIGLLRLVAFGDLQPYSDPAPKKTMKGE